jgi:hypothetical protein
MAVKAAGYTDAQVIEIVQHVALNVWNNYILISQRSRLANSDSVSILQSRRSSERPHSGWGRVLPSVSAVACIGRDVAAESHCAGAMAR